MTTIDIESMSVKKINYFVRLLDKEFKESAKQFKT